MRKSDYRPLRVSQVLREFAKCFKDKKLRARYPYVVLEGDTIIATDGYVILKYKHHAPFIKGAVYVKLDHVAQLSAKDDLMLDGEYLQGSASGLIIPARFEPVPLFDSVKSLHSREFDRLVANPEPVSEFFITSELLYNAIGTFYRLSFEVAHLRFDTMYRPMGVISTKHYYQSGSMVYSELEAIVNYRKEN